MKIYNQSLSKIQNEFLQEILKQLISQHYLIREVLFNTNIESDYIYLIICMENSSDMEKLQKQPWVEKHLKNINLKYFSIIQHELKDSFLLEIQY